MTFGLSGAALAGIAVGGATLVSGLAQSNAASSAAATQAGSAQSGIDEQRRQFDAVQKLLAPYVQAGGQGLAGYSPSQQAGAGALPTLPQSAQAGAPALEQQQALIGLRGPEAQRAAIAGISGGEQFKALTEQGEGGLLSAAAATGGLRGGNLQGALAQFRPQLLNELINQQYGRLGGLATQGGNVAQNLASSGLSATGELARIGQASAAGVGTAGQQTGTNIANLMGQQGAAMAGADIAQGRAFGAIPSGIAGGLGIFRGLGGTFGNAPSSSGGLMDELKSYGVF